MSTSNLCHNSKVTWKNTFLKDIYKDRRYVARPTFRKYNLWVYANTRRHAHMDTHNDKHTCMQRLASNDAHPEALTRSHTRTYSRTNTTVILHSSCDAIYILRLCVQFRPICAIVNCLDLLSIGSCRASVWGDLHKRYNPWQQNWFTEAVAERTYHQTIPVSFTAWATAAATGAVSFHLVDLISSIL